MKVVAIIQARMGSSRLPGKVLKDIAGRTMLARVVERAQLITGIDEIVVATTTAAADDAVAAEAKRLAVSCFRGSELDVLDRYYQAAVAHEADAVVRVTADCPLLDPEVSSQVVSAFLEQLPDYASNTRDRTYPRGLDTEIFSFAVLRRAWQETTQPYEREHVTPYFYENPSAFKLLSVSGGPGPQVTGYRWTVDTSEDLQFARAVYEAFCSVTMFSWQDVISLLKERPNLLKINAHVKQKPYRS